MRVKKNAVVWTHLCWVGCMRQKCTLTATATATTEQNKKYTTKHETVAAINGTWEMSSRYSWAEQFTRRNVYHITSHHIISRDIFSFYAYMHGNFAMAHSRKNIYGRWKISVHYNATIILGQIDFSAIPFERLCILYMWQCIVHICSMCNTVVGCYHTISLFD